MASKDYYRKQITSRREKIIDLRADIEEVKKSKKKRMESLSNNIKTTSSASSKENYRKMKVSEGASFDRKVEALKSKIESVKKEIASLQKSMANAK